MIKRMIVKWSPKREAEETIIENVVKEEINYETDRVTITTKRGTTFNFKESEIIDIEVERG